MVRAACLIRNAEVFPENAVKDIRIRRGLIAEQGQLAPVTGEKVIDAGSACLLPGLNDHHIHLASYAASLASVPCGPPADETTLIARLNSAGGSGEWLRGTGYHESVAGGINRAWLDKHGPDRPVRIQHRSGRLWIVNSAGLAKIRDGAAGLAAAERTQLDSDDGRLFDADGPLGKALGLSPPDMGAASRRLASFGVTGVNDMTPGNEPATWRWFDSLQRTGALLQRVALSGRASLSEMTEMTEMTSADRLFTGARKFHLHEHDLPPLESFMDDIRAAHSAGRGIAVHCVTYAELVFTLSALQSAGSIPADRIEHASVVEPAALDLMRKVGAGVVTQPNFVRERGDTYLAEVAEHKNLYRCASLQAAGLRVAFGTDAAFGEADPWAAMRAAVDRRTASGKPFAPDERIGPESAVSGFLGSLRDPFTPRRILPGAVADLCLLDRPWAAAREHLRKDMVRLTMARGQVIYERAAANGQGPNTSSLCSPG